MRDTAAAAEFDRLLREHVPVLYRYAYRWTGKVDEAEDLVQELLTRLFPRLDELRRIEKLRPWVTRVMYRIFVDDLRRTRRSPVQYVGGSGVTGSHIEDEDEEAADVSHEPSMLAELALDRERITAAWAFLNEQHRVMLSLHDIEGYSLEEVAAIVEVPLGTVKSRLHRARQQLRALLEKGTNSGAGACSTTGTPTRAQGG